MLLSMSDFPFQTADHDLPENDPVPVPDEVWVEDTSQPEPDASAPAAAGSRTSSGPDRRSVKRWAGKALEFERAPAPVKKMAAQILGTEPDALDMTVSLFAGNGSRQAVDDLLSVADQPDPFDAMAAASILAEKGRLSPAWALALALKLTLPDRPPAVPAKAGAAFARAVAALDAPGRSRLADVAALLRRS